MPATKVPLPPSGTFIASVRSSCEAAVKRAQIQITDEAIKAFLLSIDQATYVRLSQAHGHAGFPLAFPDDESELNFLSCLALLNGFSSFRAPLHKAVQRGTFDTIRFFLMSLFLSSTEKDLLGAKAFSTITEAEVASLMGGLPLMTEREHETMKGIVVGEKGGRLAEMVDLTVGLLHETGEVLLKAGYQSLGALVKDILFEGDKKGGSDTEKSEYFVERLVRTIPGFQDCQIVDGEPVYLFKKALFLLHTLSLRYPVSSSSPFPVPSTTTNLPTFADNVIPTLLLHLSLIAPSPTSSLAQAFLIIPPLAENPLLAHSPSTDAPSTTPSKPTPDGGPVLSLTDSTLLRAAAVHALERSTRFVFVDGGMDGEPGCEWMRQKDGGISETGLDGFVWAGGKDRPDWRKVERFVTDSVFY